MKKLLLVIDYQVDFVAKDGKLTAGLPAQAIEDAIIERINRYQTAGADVLCTLDTHPVTQWQNHPEEDSFPLHCEENTPGWELFGKLAEMNLDTITKTSYMMDYEDIDWIVRQYDYIELAGVTTDICVLQNAIGLYVHAANIGKQLKLVCNKSLVASFDQKGHKYALDYMSKKLGVLLEVEEQV